MLFPAMKPDVDMTKEGEKHKDDDELIEEPAEEEHNDDDEPIEEPAAAAGDQS